MSSPPRHWTSFAPPLPTVNEAVLHAGGVSAASGKTAVVTGGSAGLGKATVEGLIRAGCQDVLVIGQERDQNDATAIELHRMYDHIRKPLAISLFECDLSNNQSVAECARQVQARLMQKQQHAGKEADDASVCVESEQMTGHRAPLEILVLTANVEVCGGMKAKDGADLTFATNVRGHFLLSHLLLPNILAADKGRIVWVSSARHRNAMTVDFTRLLGTAVPDNDATVPTRSSQDAYDQSMLADILVAKEMARRLKSQAVHDVFVHACEPTDFTSDFLFRHKTLAKIVSLIAMHSPGRAAATLVFLAIDPSIETEENGSYWKDCVRIEPSRQAHNVALATSLYDALLLACDCDFVQLTSAKRTSAAVTVPSSEKSVGAEETNSKNTL